MLIATDILILPDSHITTCNILTPEYCALYNRDPFTIVTIIWASLQLTWVLLLLVTQLVQVSRNQTTWEIMRNRMHLRGTGERVAATVMAGTTSLDAAQLTPDGRGPDPTAAAPQHQHQHRHGHAHAHPHARVPKEGCFEQWKKLLGVDTFVATTMHGEHSGNRSSRRTVNLFNRGIATNCHDFFFDPAPIFSARKESGMALLGGVEVNYTSIWEPPPKETVVSAANGRSRGPGYQAVAGDEEV